MEIYAFADGEFEFFTAGQGGIVTIFRVRTDSWPERRAREKNIQYKYLRPSSIREIERWMETHPDFPVNASYCRGKRANGDF